MKLLLLSDAAAPHTRRWANWFAANGHEVHVATFNNETDSGYANVAIHYLWHGEIPVKCFAKLKRSVLILWRLLKLVKSIRPEVTHSHSLGAYAFSSTLLNIRPRVLTPWGLDLLIDVNVSWLSKFLVKMSLSSANAVTTDAVHFVDQLKLLGVKAEKMHLIPFGTDINRFKPLSLKTDNGSITIISTRTLNPVHCVGDLMLAIPQILSKHSNAQFIIVGGGTEFETFRSLFYNSVHHDKVLFTGMLNEDSLIEYLRVSDIYISTSPLDAGLAASTAEAMSCGLPVIHPDVADNRSWVDERGGSLYESRNVSALVQSIDSLISQTSKFNAMGDFNRNTIYLRNNLNVNMTNMLKIYLDMVHKQ